MKDLEQKALDFATEAHKGQLRKFNGEPYVNHPMRVASTVAKITNNSDLVAAAYLHDTIEDTHATFETLRHKFGCVVAELVLELTNVYTKDDYPDWNRKKRHSEEAKRLATASWSARLIKLADRLDNIHNFRRDDPAFGPKYYYVKETKELIKAIADDSSEHKLLVKQIERVLDV